MEATCTQGHVLLAGSVPQRWMKYRAEDMADAVRGVASVENRLRVDATPGEATQEASRRAGDAPAGGHSARQR